jgi:hypothetical protein
MYEFWREKATGEVWAIELEEGIVVGGSGPLHSSEVDPAFLREGYEYLAEQAVSVEARREEFEPLDEATVILIARSVD